MKIRTYYRIIEVNAAGHYLTLFHGIDGSRRIPKDKWLRAKKHMVTDGGREYLSGFHVLRLRGQAEQYLQRFYKPRVLMIIPVEVKGKLRLKEHANSEVWLADWMRVMQHDEVDQQASIFHRQLRGKVA